ncbi:MAG: FecR domain-containing protein [Burkholderiales bacterium]
MASPTWSIFPFALAAILLAPSAQANSGRIEFVNGNVTLQGSNGQTRPIARGTEVASGDTLRTNSGLVQIRFSDGGIVSLRPDTEYVIEQYRFAGSADGSEQGAFRLLKGTMRTVTGFVGRINRNSYTLYTPTATIGIRGTGGVIAVDATTGATRLFGTSGTWDLRSQTGPSIPVSAGQTGRTVSATQPAESAAVQPPTSPAPAAQKPAEPGFSTAENRVSSGTTTALASSSTSTAATTNGAVMHFLGTVGGQSVAFVDVQGTRAGSAEVKVLSSGGIPTRIEATNLSVGGQSVVTNVVSGTLAEGGTAGDYSWGRLINANVTQVYSSSSGPHTDSRLIGPNGGFYFAIGPATQDMPKTGSFVYSLIPGAQARPSFRSEAPITASLNSGQLSGTFTATGGTLFGNLGLTVNSQTMNMSGSGPINGNTFSIGGSTTGGACATGCTSSMQGGFSGSGAPFAAAGYLIFLPTDAIGGMAIFRKQ